MSEPFDMGDLCPVCTTPRAHCNCITVDVRELEAIRKRVSEMLANVAGGGDLHWPHCMASLGVIGILVCETIERGKRK